MDKTADCGACSEPVVLAEPHIAFIRQVETEHGGSVTVTDSEVISYRHLSCPGRSRSARTLTAAAVE